MDYKTALKHWGAAKLGRVYQNIDVDVDTVVVETEFERALWECDETTAQFTITARADYDTWSYSGINRTRVRVTDESVYTAVYFEWFTLEGFLKEIFEAAGGEIT